MIKAKFGDCSVCNLSNTLLYRRNPAECKVCYFKGKLEKKKKPKRIPAFSDKKLEQHKEYRILRDKYLSEHPICEVHDCNKPTTNLHHKKGRIGDLLCNVNYFMACCSTCHPQRIHENPKWAREHNYLI
jgi:hypothetical protein